MCKNYGNCLVSVIIPVYNSERFIGETIDSVLSQTYKDIEIVLIDDFSKDNSRSIIENYANINKNIIYHYQEKNMGVAVARNTALELSNGRYIAFLDSDDKWYPNKVEKQIDLMTKKKSPFSYTAIEMISEDNNIVKYKRKVKDKIDYKFLLKNTMIATSSVIIDRNIVKNFKMPLIRSGQDYAAWLHILKNGIAACGIDEALVQYRVLKNSLSSNKFKSIKQVYITQTQMQNIPKYKAAFNTFCFSINAVKKYFF